MFWLILFPLTVTLPAAAVFHLIPVWRTGTYFAVRVAAGFQESPEGRAILTRYRMTNAILFVIATALMAWGVSRRNPWILVPGSLVQSLGMMAATYIARKQVWPHRQPSEMQRTAELGMEDPLPVWTLPLWTFSPMIIGGAAWYLSQHWNSIPATFPVHWGLDDQPNGWEQKSFKGVYGSLMTGASTMILLYGAAVFILFGARRSPGDIRVMRATLASLLGIMTSVSLLLARIALGPLFPQRSASPLSTPFAMALPVGLIAISLLPMWFVRKDAAEYVDATPDECWTMGNLYSNPDDPALMVRNRIGFGYSPNFGHPAMKFAFLLLLAQLIAMVVYVA
jgi:uncharacterized membrane protein